MIKNVMANLTVYILVCLLWDSYRQDEIMMPAAELLNGNYMYIWPWPMFKHSTNAYGISTDDGSIKTDLQLQMGISTFDLDPHFSEGA